MLKLQFLSSPVVLAFLNGKSSTCCGRMKAGVKQQRSWLKAGAADGAGPLGVFGNVGVKSTSVGWTAQSALSRMSEKRCLAVREWLSAIATIQISDCSMRL